MDTPEQKHRIPLGPFELHARIGKGGMGEVWRGVHTDQNVPVAVKVMTEKRARNPKYLVAFSNEVRAVARLNHPGVVMVFDHGETPRETEKQSAGLIAQGCPYLVMELCSGGALSQLDVALDWPTVRSLLLSLLEALAHAHARGVIHRDLKPANVMLSTREDQRPGLKLTDFGIAHAIDAGDALLKGAGTPRYMAPEQIIRRWRDQGPWTDLYALGCLAYQLVSGSPPYTMKHPKKVLEAHLTKPPPPLEPRIVVPDELTPWIGRLLRKRPGNRFRNAADAAWALIRMGGAEAGGIGGGDPVAEAVLRQMSTASAPDRPGVSRLGDGPGPDDTLADGALPAQLTREIHLAPKRRRTVPAMGRNVGSGPTGPTGHSADLERDSHVTFDLELSRGFEEFAHRAEIVEGAGTDSSSDRPPLPETWRHPQPAEPSMPLVGTGLGLFGLRPVPLVDREATRDTLWGALREADQAGEPRMLALFGPAGVGKTRLVEWIAERAREVGGATVLKAVHSPRPGPDDGLGPMLAQHLRCTGLDNEKVVARLERLLRQQDVNDPYEWRALAEIIAPVDSETVTDTSRLVYFPHESARFGVIARMLSRLATERPVLLWLDDVQWGQDALALAQYLLTTDLPGRVPLLIVTTVQHEALPDRNQERALLDELLELPEADRLEIPPLDERDRRQLVRGLLRLSGELAERVAERTAGNPLFAVQLVGDWVQRGVLEVGRDGFVLAPGQRVELPDDLHAVWAARVERVLEGRPAIYRPALEIAAALGLRVDAWEWQFACAESDTVRNALAELPGTSLSDVTAGLLRSLIELHLAHRLDGGRWAFSHGMLRESVERLAREAGRWRFHHAACASMLPKCHPLGGRGVAERLGRHLVGAERYEEAADPLLEGAIERREASEYGAAQDLVGLREDALLKARLPESYERWGRGWVVRSRIHVDLDQLDDATRWATAARDAALAHGWRPVLADAQAELGTIHTRRGDQDAARESLRQASDLYLKLGDELGYAQVLRALGTAEALSGGFDEAGRLMRQALAIFERQQALFDVARVMRNQANLAWISGHQTRAGVLYDQTLALCQQIDDRLGAALCTAGLAEVARVEGRLDAAERLYRQAIRTLRALDPSWEQYRTSLAMVLLARGEYREARQILERAARLTERKGQRGYLACVSAALMVATAGEEDWPSWELNQLRAGELLEETGMIEPDVAWSARRAGELARAHGEVERARQAFELARAQYAALGQGTHVRSLDAALAELGG